MTTTTEQYRVCHDCYVYGYALYTDRSHYPDVDDERWERIVREYGRTWTVDDVPNVTTDDETWQEPSFSWSPCETCGDVLGGDRYRVDITYRKGDGEW